mmetsp:Transcript_62429/g.197821  ORF Transcript_62429/g.197821 Transcript_62429/m.197821 type:complete len:360 (-) Transcript_62429:227-1306(-)
MLEAQHVLAGVGINALQGLEELVVHALEERAEVAPHLGGGARDGGAGLVLLLIGGADVLVHHDHGGVGLEDLQDPEDVGHALLPNGHRHVRVEGWVHVELRGHHMDHNLELLRRGGGDGGEVVEHLDLLVPVRALLATGEDHLAQLLRDHLLGDLLGLARELLLALLLSLGLDLLEGLVLRGLGLVLVRVGGVGVLITVALVLTVGLVLLAHRVGAEGRHVGLVLAVVLLEPLAEGVERLGVGAAHLLLGVLVRGSLGEVVLEPDDGLDVAAGGAAHALRHPANLLELLVHLLEQVLEGHEVVDLHLVANFIAGVLNLLEPLVLGGLDDAAVVIRVRVRVRIVAEVLAGPLLLVVGIRV